MVAAPFDFGESRAIEDDLDTPSLPRRARRVAKTCRPTLQQTNQVGQRARKLYTEQDGDDYGDSSSDGKNNVREDDDLKDDILESVNEEAPSLLSRTTSTSKDTSRYSSTPTNPITSSQVLNSTPLATETLQSAMQIKCTASPRRESFGSATSSRSSDDDGSSVEEGSDGGFDASAEHVDCASSERPTSLPPRQEQRRVSEIDSLDRESQRLEAMMAKLGYLPS